VDAQTGQRETLVEGLPDFRSGYATWSPDHLQVAFADRGIAVLDPETGGEVTFVEGQGLSMPTWNPSGTHLAYSDGLSLWVTSLGRVAPRRIHVPAILAPLQVAWGPSNLLAFQGVNLDCSQAVRCVSTGSSEIWTIGPGGTGLTKLTRVGRAESPKWSADGSQVLFIRSYPSPDQRSEVWTVDSTGSHLRRLAILSSAVAADWSPDGSHLAILAEEGDELQLWVGRADGTRLERVGEPFSGSHATVDW
jgi:Tol biopolymer transport system component